MIVGEEEKGKIFIETIIEMVVVKGKKADKLFLFLIKYKN